MVPLQFVVGLALGLGVAAALYFWVRGRNAAEVADARARLEAEMEAHSAVVESLRAKELQLQQNATELGRVRVDLATALAQLDAERRTVDEKIATLAAAEERLKDAFAALSQEALKSSNESFLQLAKTTFEKLQEKAVGELEKRENAVSQLVLPLQQSLDTVGKTVAEIEKSRIEAYSRIDEQLKSLANTQNTLQAETNHLVNALRSPNVRGQWGEMQLRRVVEAAGMVEHCDFDFKETVGTEDGRLIPDLLVRLPGGKNVVVDSKVPATAFLEAITESNDDAREARLREHARQVRDHIAKLAAKSYWAHFQPTPDIVVMFLPGESLLSAALLHDPSLLDFSVSKGVMLASPLTLIGLLRAVAFGWQQEALARNAQEISSLGQQLYDRIRVLLEHLDDLGRDLQGSVDAYNRVLASLGSRVLVTARKLKELGVATTKELPDVHPVDVAPRSPQNSELAGLLGEAAVDGELVAPLSDETEKV
ncbi:MAG TPA: DNA recombination protein RmuC [Vicinamibacterales bacterium]|nr:DNA recombination protein RmuC [Vicinamibacterales bacterium]